MSLKPALGVPALGVLVLEIQGSFPAAVMLGTRASNGKQSKLNDVQIGKPLIDIAGTTKLKPAENT